MSDSEPTLEHFLHFSDADLAANRDGMLGPGQVRRLRWSGIWRLLVGPVLLIVSTLMAITAVTPVSLVSLVLLSLAAYGLYLAWRGFAFLVDSIDVRVGFITARLELRVVHGKTTSYYANCGPVSKLISAKAYDGLPEGLTCHLYYAPGSRSLLSIEAATNTEPKPDHPFGPDSAHAWDRLRVSWVAITIGVLGLGIAAHGIFVARPAHALPVEGTVSNYDETHGKGAYRHLFLRSDPNPYTPYVESSYDPPVLPFATLIGRNVVLFVNEGSRDVLAINDGERLHASDWYAHPDHQKTFQIWNAVIVAAGSAIAVALGVIGVGPGRRLASRVAQPAQSEAQSPLFAATPAYSLPSLYAPPSVRPLYANWVIVPVLALVGAAVGLGIALAAHV